MKPPKTAEETKKVFTMLNKNVIDQKRYLAMVLPSFANSFLTFIVKGDYFHCQSKKIVIIVQQVHKVTVCPSKY